MTVTTEDRIETDVLVHAPLERVWELVSRAEHLGRWFGDVGADVDLAPGGAFTIRWADHVAHGRVVTAAPPHRLAYRWMTGEHAEATTANSTLVEFVLAEEDGSTRVTVTESGFERLALDEDARAARLAAHADGWPVELDHLVSDAAR